MSICIAYRRVGTREPRRAQIFVQDRFRASKISNQLQDLGFAVSTPPIDGALALIDAFGPDVVIVEEALHTSNGRPLFEAMRRNTSCTVLVLTDDEMDHEHDALDQLLSTSLSTQHVA